MHEGRMLRAWRDNASSWTTAVREKKIASRLAVTDDAILEAVGEGRDLKILDLGCGEGWLAYRLSERGWWVTGVDAVDLLVSVAREGGEVEFLTVSYEDLEAKLKGRTFHTVVANFSLLGEASVEAAFQAIPGLLDREGRFIIQTLHPLAVSPYRDGWREEDWRSLGELPCVSTPWYLRTLQSWMALICESGFQLCELREPRVTGAGGPSSLLMVLRFTGTESGASGS